MKSSLLPILIFAAAGTAAAGFAQAPDTVAPSSAPSSVFPRLQAGELAPDFEVVGPTGKTIKLSDFRGKMLLVDIWATWCGPCVASMPHNSELAKKFAKDDLVVLAVCADDSRRWVLERRQIDKKDAVGKVRRQRKRYLQRQPGLATAAWATQRN